MKVLFDHQAFVIQRFGGVSRYYTELARGLRLQSDMQPQIFAPAYVTAYLQAGDPLHPLSFELTRWTRGLRQRSAAILPLLWAAVQLQRPQVLHETVYEHCLGTLPPGVLRVSTLHDMIFELFPEHFNDPVSRSHQKIAALRRADAIICISESSRRDLIKFYPEFAERAHVVHHGVAHGLKTGPRPPELPEEYVLFVGTRQAYKNFGRLVEALGALGSAHSRLKLVCFGGGPLSSAERQMCAQAGWAAERIVHIQGDDDLLASAYRHALLFVFPSMYEGFGMPLTEAMAQACPIACADASCFPEICQDSALFFDPTNVAEIRACLESVLQDDEQRRRLAGASFERGRAFTWDRCAEQTAAVYRQAWAPGRVKGAGGAKNALL